MHKKFVSAEDCPGVSGVGTGQRGLPRASRPELLDQAEELRSMPESMVAKVQFAADWVRFDISYPATQLARFCASAGPSHWAALAHLLGYLIHRPSLKLKYRRDAVGGLDGFTAD